MITLYNEKDEKLKLISAFEFNDADMGESSISATVSFDKEQDFHPDWYVIYNGEKFRLGVRKPTGKKDTSSLSTAYTLVFKSEREDLKRYTFMDFVELGTGNPQPSSYKVPLYATLSELVDRFNLNLRYYLGNRWQMVLPQGYVEDGNAVSVSFDNASLWDVLLRFYEIHGVRWVIRGVSDVMQIQVGFPEVEIEHVFEYGKGNGLVSVERNNALERIITRLRGRGGEKNLPPDYFHAGDPDTNSFLQATFFQNLMPKSYRDYIRGYNAGSGEGTWAYNKGVADRINGSPISPVDYAISDKEDLWGISYGAIEPNELIFPTLQGATRDGVRLDEVLSVEQVLVDGVREPLNTITIGIGTGGKEDSSGKCGDSKQNWYLKDCRDGISFNIYTDKFNITNPINSAQVRLTMTPSIIGEDGLPISASFGDDSRIHVNAEFQLVDLTNSITGEIIRSIPVVDVDTYLWQLEDIPIGEYRLRAHISWNANIESSNREVVVNVDTRLTAAQINEYARSTDKGEWKETFDIEIRDVWGIGREDGETDSDYTYRVWSPRAVSEEMTVMFSDGLLAGEDYEFRIVGFSSDSDNLYQVITSAIKPTSSGGWKLTLQKSDAELQAANIYLPNTMQNAKAGDHFFFVNISMPYDPYVYNAEQRVQDYLDEQLSMKDEEFPSFTITPSKIFCSTFTEADKIQAGAKIRVRNTALVGDSYISLYIQSLTKRYTSDSLNPEWSLTLSDLVVASGNPVETLEGEVSVLSQRVYTNRQSIQEAVRSLSSTFLRKDGISDTSYSPTEFSKPVKVGESIADKNFISGDINGKGFGVYTDSDGNRVLETDILVGRIGARFNEVQINQATYSAGKQIFSGAGMVVDRVEDNGDSWRCYFNTKNATVRNYFQVGDGAFCQRFVDSGPRQYWARVVAIGGDYIDISKTDRLVGSFDPLEGDSIARLGNNTDKSRQAALVIDETRDGGGLVTWYDDIDNFTLSDKDSVNIGRIDGKTWFQVYGSGYIGAKDGTQYVKYENGALTLKGKLEVGSKISDALTVVEDGLIQSTLLKLGYSLNGVFKVMSGTNGLYDENANGGGIAAWYGGPMIDKEADKEAVEFAKALLRFNGTGYFAGGNITWNEDGSGSVANGNLSWDANGRLFLKSNIVIGDSEEETLGGVLQLLTNIIDWFEVRTLENGDKVLYTKYNLAAKGEVTAGSESGESGSSSSGAAYNRLDTWENYNENAGDVLSAKLGYALKQQIEQLQQSGGSGESVVANITVKIGNAEYTAVDGVVSLPAYPTVPTVPTKLSELQNDAGYITNAALGGYATLSDIGPLDERLTIIESNYLDSITQQMVIDALDYTPFDSASFTKANIKSALGIADWALASSKPSYSWGEITSKPTLLSQFTDDVVAGNYLPLTGGILSGALSAPSINITSAAAIAHLAFGRQGGNFITAPSGGYFTFIPGGKSIATANADLVITDGIVYPGTTGVTKLGFGDKRWSQVSSVNGDFSGALTAGTFSTANVVSCGGRLRINASNSVTSFGFLKATAYTTALNRAVLDIGSNYGGSDNIASEAVDVVAMSMYRGAVGIGRAFTYDELYANRASNVMLSVEGNINNVGDIVSTGEQVAGSDMRYKIVKSKFRLSSAIIAHAPLFRFKWKNHKTTKLKIGTSAQYWEEFAPELVTFDSVSDFKHLNYAGLGVAIGISNAREIEQLKKEIVSLKERLSKYEHN